MSEKFRGLRLGDERFTWKQLEEMDTDDLMDVRNDAQDSLLDIIEQINFTQAQGDQQDSNSDWMCRARTAKAKISWAIQRISSILKDRRTTQKTMHVHFIDVSREILEDDTFHKILHEACNREKAGVQASGNNPEIA